nr:STM3941 family protein [uncultured Chryseobacterium sp.]
MKDIKKNKKKLFLIVAIMTILLIIGIIAVLNPTKYTSFIYRNEMIIFIVGVMSIIISIYLIFKFGIKLFDQSAKFLITDEGIYDGVSILNYPFIKWNDIVGIEECCIKNVQHVKILLKDPHTYINKKSGFTKWVLNYNYNTYQSPIILNCTYLSCSFNDFKNSILDSYTKYDK